MKRLSIFLAMIGILALAAPASAAWQVVMESCVPLAGHPESVAYNAQEKALYASNFGAELKPRLKDGKGYISKLTLDGKMLDERFLPGPGQSLNKPKGVWTHEGLLWTTDIDSAWVFDLASRKGRQVMLPGAKFANDVVVDPKTVFVSDNASGYVFLIRPPDFLSVEPKVSRVLEKANLTPNGLFMGLRGSLIFGTTAQGGAAGGLFEMTPEGEAKPLAEGLGSLDGVAVLPDGSILYTDWQGKGLYILEPGAKPRRLASGFGGPADFALVTADNKTVVVVPDLVKGGLRFITITDK